MAYIKGFKISGLSGRKDSYEQVLNRDVNIFFGQNGCGKTSLLRILDSAMNGTAVSIVNVPFTTAQVDIYSEDYRTTLNRYIEKNKSQVVQLKSRDSVRLLNYDDERAIYYVDEVASIDENKKKHDIKWKYKNKNAKAHPTGGWVHNYLPTWRLYTEDMHSSTIRKYRDFDANDSFWDNFFAKKIRQIWRDYTSKTTQKVKKIQEDGIAEILLGVLSASESKSSKKQNMIEDPAAVFQRVQDFLSRQGSKNVIRSQKAFIEKLGADKNLNQVVSDINDIEKKIENVMASQNQFRSLIKDMFASNKQISFTEREIIVVTDEGHIIGLETLSSGEKHLLQIFIQVLLTEGNTLIIDEPELSLHIDWQTKLVEYIRLLNPDLQLIVATHSPEIMAEISDDKIFRL